MNAAGTGGVSDVVGIAVQKGSLFQSETHVAKGPSGLVAASWISFSASGYSNIGYAFSIDDGSSFLPAKAIDAPLMRVGSDPVMVFDSAGNAYLTWIGFHQSGMVPTDFQVLVSTAPATTGVFGDPVVLAEGPSLDKPWITLTRQGTILVTWSQMTNQLIAARSVDGATWTTSVAVGLGSYRNLAFPCVTQHDDRIWLTYLSSGAVRLAWSDDDGQTWPPANKVIVNAPGETIALSDPTCASNGAEVWVAYGVTSDPNNFNDQYLPKLDSIRVAHSPDGGSTIDARTDAMDKNVAVYSLIPQLDRDDATGDLHVAFYGGDSDGDPKGGLFRRRSSDGGMTWLPSQIVAGPIRFATTRTQATWVGDYFGLHVGNGSFYSTFVKNENAQGLAHVVFHREPL